MAFYACEEVVFVLESIPENTPEKATIYVTGNFNFWDPGDSEFTLSTTPEGQYFIRLPKGKGRIQYVFTRGDWNTKETDICGNPIKNRTFEYGSLDTLYLNIGSWKDKHPLNCPDDTTVIKIYPKETK